ncbi:MAG: HAD family hydrolase [Deltaproteobacteria bacterium]
MGPRSESDPSSGELAPLQARLLGPPGLAAFDADGTLWHGDVGEALLRRLIRERRLVDPPPGDVFAEYARRVESDPRDGFAFAARVLAGLPLALVRELSGRVFEEEFSRAFFPAVVGVFRALLGRGWDVFIVSASLCWSVEPGAKALGLAPDRVIGVAVELQEGRLTDRVLHVPTLEGKPDLLRARAGRDPDLAFGNSMLEGPLLASAGVAVAVLPQGGETPLSREAARRGWLPLRVDLP